jgi:hypothetical protein
MSERIGFTKEQLIELTSYSRSSKRCEALAFMGIRFWVRMDGTPFVSLSAFSSEESDKPPKVEARLNLI